MSEREFYVQECGRFLRRWGPVRWRGWRCVYGCGLARLHRWLWVRGVEL
jgi:hypothetical protein